MRGKDNTQYVCVRIYIYVHAKADDSMCGTRRYAEKPITKIRSKDNDGGVFWTFTGVKKPQ